MSAGFRRICYKEKLRTEGLQVPSRWQHPYRRDDGRAGDAPLTLAYAMDIIFSNNWHMQIVLKSGTNRQCALQAELEDGDIIDMMVTQIGGSC